MFLDSVKLCVEVEGVQRTFMFTFFFYFLLTKSMDNFNNILKTIYKEKETEKEVQAISWFADPMQPVSFHHWSDHLF